MEETMDLEKKRKKKKKLINITIASILISTEKANIWILRRKKKIVFFI